MTFWSTDLWLIWLNTGCHYSYTLLVILEASKAQPSHESEQASHAFFKLASICISNYWCSSDSSFNEAMLRGCSLLLVVPCPPSLHCSLAGVPQPTSYLVGKSQGLGGEITGWMLTAASHSWELTGEPQYRLFAVVGGAKQAERLTQKDSRSLRRTGNLHRTH